MQQPAPNIYAGPLLDMTEQTYAGMKRIAKSSGQLISYVGNGHAAWEACLCNTVSPGDSVVAMVNGRFGGIWAKIAEALGVDVQWIRSAADNSVDAEQLRKVLKADSQQKIKAVLSVQTDTSSSISNDIAAVRQALDDTGHPALLLVDGIASFACEPMLMDEWGIDVLVAACQKGLMTPPGLAFNFVSDKAWQWHKKASRNTPYWDWQPRVSGELFPEKFGGTPPTHLLLALHEAVKMLEEEGIENTWERHRTHAQCVWAAVDAWRGQGDIGFYIQDPTVRSTAVTTITTGDKDATRIQEWIQENTGVVLGVGLKAQVGEGLANNQFRIGHMGHLSPPMIMGTLSCVNSALLALDIEHGAGALDQACRVIAGR
jgi:alanine-glyoxylate transaminase/serine-glyoxylate transaminase/serine-pyruvate transaminase